METKYLILISGKMQTGKNAFADLFEKECWTKDYDVKMDSFASVLKEWCCEEFKILTDYLNSFSDEVKANIPFFGDIRFEQTKDAIHNVINKIQTKRDNWFNEKNDITRLILQVVGTNLFRKHVDNDFWIKELIKKVNKYQEKYVIVTDARFPNEIDLPHKLIENRRIISIRMQRDTAQTSTHPSETALDTYAWFDYTIENNGNLKMLEDSAKTVFNDIESTLTL